MHAILCRWSVCLQSREEVSWVQATGDSVACTDNIRGRCVVVVIIIDL